MVSLPTPHGDKLKALLVNPKLPIGDRPRLQETLTRYDSWRRDLERTSSGTQKDVERMVSLLNAYKMHVDVDLIFDSADVFLYRQKGQLKLDNSIIEEFLPLLVTIALRKDLNQLDVTVGPVSSFSGLRFDSNIGGRQPGAGLTIRTKDQDFSISRRLFIRASNQEDFRDSVTREVNLAYVASEIKTNLDKTMFQEAAATAIDLKSQVPGGRYYVLCEWLDMTPISTLTTAIDEVLILRGAKRLASNVRSKFATPEGRRQSRTAYVKYLTDHPLSANTFGRFLDHVRRLVALDQEDDVLARGHF